MVAIRSFALVAVLLPLLVASSSAATEVRPDAQHPCGVTRTAPVYHHWVVIVLENHSFADVDDEMPFLNGLAARCGIATEMTALARPSLPNYIAMTSGAVSSDRGRTFVGTDCSPGPSCQTSRPSIFSQLGAANTWTFAEAMPGNCARRSTRLYPVRHNPEPYFVGERSACPSNNVPMGTPTAGNLKTAIAGGTLRSFNLLIPDNCHSQHNCGVAAGDRWLKGWLPKILTGPNYKAGDTVVAVLWDEPNEHSRTRHTSLYTVIISPSTPTGTRVATAFDHYSLLRTVEQELGKPYIGAAATAASWQAGFNL